MTATAVDQHGRKLASAKPNRRLVQALDPDLLGRALAARYLRWYDLRRSPPGFSRPTVRALKSGRPVSVGTLKRLDAFLQAVPVLPEVGGLLADVEAPK